MEKISWLITKINQEYPEFKIERGQVSFWSPNKKTIFINPAEQNPEWILLHELGHAVLNHFNFQRDISLLEMERQAWDEAEQNLAPKFGLKIDSDFIEDHLDSYRDWLHAKSLCPECDSNGFEFEKNIYRCPLCGTNWKTNAATQAGLKRYRLPKK